MNPRTVCFFLPQFHTIPENDAWWGEGFTEWTNVRKARPAFAGHEHPKQPGELGYYDLTDTEVLSRQAELARLNGVDAFCFYFYWFDGQRLLERPLDAFAEVVTDFEYCISWANEPWTRRWDGKEHDVLMPQTYPENFETAIFQEFLTHFRNSNYLTMDDRPILVVHRVTQIPDCADVAAKWRELAVRAGLPGIYLVAAETVRGVRPDDFGFDAVAEFPPVGSNTLSAARLKPLAGLSRTFRGRLLSYDRMAASFMRRRTPRFVRHRGVTPRWDNTARRGDAATVYVGDSPRSYRAWLSAARRDEARLRGEQGLVFVNAWNEWAEGAYLEPDEAHGSNFLRATSTDPADARIELPGASPATGRHYTFGHVRSLGLTAAGSLLNVARHVRRATHQALSRGPR